MDARDVARLDRKEYDEPGRDLTATKPAPGGAPGDVDNPVADEHSHGMGDLMGDEGVGAKKAGHLADSDKTRT